MSFILNCQEISKSIGPRTLFNALSFTVNRGDRLAVIGANGSGKTTLLRLLSGLDTPDSGRITLLQNTLTGYLPQQEELNEEATVSEILFDALREEQLDEADRHSRIQTMLSRAEFTNFNLPVKILSGGWRKRLAISRALLRQPNMLIMDEPTNHLDLEGILWLEKLLGNSFPGSPSTFVMVSHDRYFLENLATRIVEISPLYPDGFILVEGNYSAFLRRKEQLLLQQQEQESRLANRVRRETEWLSRGPKARTSKARFRVNEAYRLTDELRHLKSRNRTQQDIKIDFDSTGRKTRKLLEAINISKSYNDVQLFSGLDITLSPGKRVGLLGKNGCGKSTLMHILAGVERKSGMKPDTGSIRTAEGIKIVYFAQDRKQLDPETTLRQALSPEGDSVIYRDRSVHVVTWAQQFLFRTDQLDTPIGNLSGGEKARIFIADLMRQPADILLLDEPTNDLDIPSLQVLEEGLLDFPGSVVLATHDRYLLNSVCDQILGFTGHGNVDFFADYEQWFRSLSDQKKTIARSDKTHRKKDVQKKAGRLSYLDQREYESMELKILSAEEMEREILLVMDNPDNASDSELLQRSWQDLEEVRAKIDQLYARWDELEMIKNSGD
jgi:ATP-binding cassette subfamily F protein uup